MRNVAKNLNAKGGLAQKMSLAYVVPHTLFLALYEMARQDVVNALKAGGVGCAKYCKKVADEVNAMPKGRSEGAPEFHPALIAILNRAYAVAQKRDPPVATTADLVVNSSTDIMSLVQLTLYQFNN